MKTQPLHPAYRRAPSRLWLEALEDRLALAALSFSTQPYTSSAGALLNGTPDGGKTIVKQIEVTVSDNSNPFVTIGVGGNPAAGQLQGTVTKQAVNGKATFTDLIIYGGKAASGETLVAYSPGHTSVESTAFDVKSGGSFLNIASEIPNVRAGVALGAITIQVLNANGTVDLTDNKTQVQLLINENPGGSTLATPVTATVSQGVATLAGVTLTKAGIGYSLRVVATNNPYLLPTVSNRFVVVHAPAAKLGFQQNPQYAVVNQPIDQNGGYRPYIATGIVAEVQDAFGNLVNDSDIPVSISLDVNPGGATFNPPPAVKAVNGLATFTGVVLDKAAEGYVFKVTSTSLAGVVGKTDPFTVLAAQPGKLAFTDTAAKTVQARGKLPVMTVQIQDVAGNPLTTDNTTLVSLDPSGPLVGTLTARAVNGVATFDNVYAYGVKVPNVINVQAYFTTLAPAPAQPVLFQGPMVTLTAGKPEKLVFEQPDIQKANPSGIIANEYMTPIVVDVIDADGNLVTNPATPIKVSLGVLLNGAHPEPTYIYRGDRTNPDADKAVYLEVTAVNGKATFDNIYMNLAGTGYQLSIGTQDFSFDGVNSQAFNVVPNVANKVEFFDAPNLANSVTEPFTTSRGWINGEGPDIFNQPVKSIVVKIKDRVGNVVTDDDRAVSLKVADQTGRGPIAGVTSLTTYKGVAIFDQVYIDQDGGPTTGYQITATPDNPSGKPTLAPITTNKFTVNAPLNIPIPEFSFDVQPPSTVGVGQVFTFSFKVVQDGTDLNAYDDTNVKVQLLDKDGRLGAPGSPVLVGVNPTDGLGGGRLIKDKATVFDYLHIDVAGEYKIRALYEVGAQAVVTTFTIKVGTGGGALVAAPGDSITAGNPNVIDAGLGSYLNNFDTLRDPANFPVYSLDEAGNPKPVSQIHFPPSNNRDDTDPNWHQVQPNVVEGFGQAPQTNDWWSSLMFQRVQVQPTTAVDKDSRNNQLFPMFADPFAAMVNSAGTFAGLGLGYLNQVLVAPAPEANANIPGQPTRQDPRFPGSINYFYNYGGVARVGQNDVASSRLHQDLSIGLTGVQADARVKSYSDWTVTIDWGGKLQATMGRGLPFTYFTANIATGATQEMQIVTKDAVKPDLKVEAFDAQGNLITNLTNVNGPVRLRISYILKEPDPQHPDANDPLHYKTENVVNNYGVFLPTGVTWSIDANGRFFTNLTSDKNYFSVAVLPEGTADINATFRDFASRAYSHVTGSTVSFTFDETRGKLLTTYTLQTVVKESRPGFDKQPIQALYPHQWLYVNQNALTAAAGTYTSARGAMKVVAGATFVTELQHQGVLPYVPPMPNTSDGYHATLYRDYLVPLLRGISISSNNDGTFQLDGLLKWLPGENYGEGQAMYGLSQLVPMLLEASASSDGLTAPEKAAAATMAERVYNLVKDRMSAWLSVKDDAALQMLYYQPRVPNEAAAPTDPTTGEKLPGWRSLMSYLAGFKSSDSLNDHHLIAGYFLKTASVLVRYDSTWGEETRLTNNGTMQLRAKLGDVIDLMVRDVSNYDRTDAEFPFLRNFDPYQGHGWADGAANDDKGNNQESTSEALNYAAGLIQWGEAIGDRYLRDLGVYLYNTEIEAFNLYYFNVTDADGTKGTNTFPTPYKGGGASERLYASKVDGNGVELSGFIGLLPTGLVGIQMLPISASSYYLGRDPAFVSKLFANVLPDPNNPGAKLKDYVIQPLTQQRYLSVLYPYLALSDPTTALSLFTSQRASILQVNPGNPIDSDAFNFHWIKVLQQYGQVDTKVRANVVSYGVFNKAGVRTFVAHNAGNLAREVIFTDFTTPNTPVRLFPGKMLMVPAGATVVFDASGNVVSTQNAADFKMDTPANRLFFSNAGGTNTFLVGRAGDGEATATIPAPEKAGEGKVVPNTQPKQHPDPNEAGPNGGRRDLVFEMRGLTGTLLPAPAALSFQLYVDPQYSTTEFVAPAIRMRITYYADNTDNNPVTHTYNNITLSNNPGVVRGVNLTLIEGIPNYLPALNNGHIKVQIWAVQGNGTPILLRTDAAEEQGRVSFIELPYRFKKVGGVDVDTIMLPAAHTPVEKMTATAAALPSRPAVNVPQAVRAATAGHTFTATLSGTTATFQGNGSADAILFSADNGKLRHNRFTAGDPGFVSNFDFDSTQAGEQTLAVSASAHVIINTGGGADTVTLGTANVPANSLLALFTINNPDAGADALWINDGARTTPGSYTISGSSIRSASQGVRVDLVGQVMGAGAKLTTGTMTNTILVTATRQGEAWTLDTSDGTDVITVGDGTLDNVKGQVTILNDKSFSDLFIDNSRDQTFGRSVTVSRTSVTGLGPTPIRFTDSDIDNLTVLGGRGHDTVYHITGAAAGSFVRLKTAAGADTVIIGDTGVIDSGKFAGRLIVEGDTTVADRIVLDNSAGEAKTLTISATALTGMFLDGIDYSGFANLDVVLGPRADTVTVEGTPRDTDMRFDLGDGNDTFTATNDAAKVLVGLTVFGSGGDDTIRGGPMGDRLVGGPGDDQLFGFGGDDVMPWWRDQGADRYDGGDGVDTVQVNGSHVQDDTIAVVPDGDRVLIQRIRPSVTVLNAGTIEKLQVNGRGGSDFIEVTPLANTHVFVNAGIPESYPSDHVVITPASLTGATLLLRSPRSGTWTFAGAQAVDFSHAEQYDWQRLIDETRRTAWVNPIVLPASLGLGDDGAWVRVGLSDVTLDGIADLLVALGVENDKPARVIDGVTGLFDQAFVGRVINDGVSFRLELQRKA